MIPRQLAEIIRNQNPLISAHTVSAEQACCSTRDGLRMMPDGSYRHVPVVEGKKTVGIVTRGDFRGLAQARLYEEMGFWELV